MDAVRSPHNPLIVPEQVAPSGPGLKVVGVFNAGALRRDGEVLLLLRVAEAAVDPGPGLLAVPVWNTKRKGLTTLHFRRDDASLDLGDPRWIGTPQGRFLTSFSHLRLARSWDGVHFKIAKRPTLMPCAPNEAYGLEDPRITPLERRYYISYSAVSPWGVAAALASTDDFQRFKRHGLMTLPDNKDVVLFSWRIGGKVYALTRPTAGEFGRRDIWISGSEDLVHWGDHRLLAEAKPGRWDGERIGAGAVPIAIHQGWLVIYHGADGAQRYCLGAMLLHPDKPWQVLARTPRPILEPETDYERHGFMDNVVFTCGALLEGKTVRIYYGAADRCVAFADLCLDALLREMAPADEG